MPTAGGTGIAGGLVMPQSRYFRPRNLPRQVNQGSQIQEAGKSIGTAIEGFGDLFRKIRQDKIANDLMNQGDQSQAAQAMQTLDNQGTLGDEPLAQEAIAGPQHTGGVDELNMRMAYQKAQLAQQLQEAQLADYQAKAAGTGRYAKPPGYNPTGGSGSNWRQQGGGGGGGSGWGKKPAKQPPYVAGSSDPNDPSSDDMAKVRADYDLVHGKGAFDKAQQNIGQWQIQNGQYVLPKLDKSGNPVLDAKGNPVVTSMMSQDEGNKWILRTNAARQAQGLPQLPVPVPVPGSNPKSTDPPGSLTNPYKPASPLESRGIPNNSYVVDPATGQVVHKVADPNYKKPASTTQTQTAQPSDSTASTDSTTDQDNLGDLGDESLTNEATTSADQDTSIDDAIDQDRAKRDLYA